MGCIQVTVCCETVKREREEGVFKQQQQVNHIVKLFPSFDSHKRLPGLSNVDTIFCACYNNILCEQISL